MVHRKPTQTIATRIDNVQCFTCGGPHFQYDKFQRRWNCPLKLAQATNQPHARTVVCPPVQHVSMPVPQSLPLVPAPEPPKMDLKSLIAAVDILTQRIHELERVLREERIAREEKDKERERENNAREEEEKRARTERKGPAVTVAAREEKKQDQGQGQGQEQGQERKIEEKEKKEREEKHAPVPAATAGREREAKERERKTPMVSPSAPGVSASANSRPASTPAPTRSVPQPTPAHPPAPTPKEVYRQRLRSFVSENSDRAFAAQAEWTEGVPMIWEL